MSPAPAPAPAGAGPVLVVEDEEHARAELSYLLQQAEVMVIEAASATEALDVLAGIQVSAVFLDIQMPGLDGLQLAQVLQKFSDPPPVVFVTAHEAHAVDAFDLDAVDYLVKPVTPERLTRTLARLRSTGAGTAGGGTGASDGAVGTAKGPDELPFVAVEVGDRVMLIERAEIRYVEARGDYVRLYTFDRHYLIRRPLSSVARSWDRHGFVRVHRSYVINLRHVVDISPGFNQSLAVRIADGERTVVPVSRRQAMVLRERLGVGGRA